MLGKNQDLFVPWQCVQKIGEDVILVEIRDLPGGVPTCVPASKSDCLPPPKKKSGGGPGGPGGPGGGGKGCDGQCEKCMLFDCAERRGAAVAE